MRLPDFLIIGAMKSGTTGLFFDVCGHPQVYMPVNKEPHALCDDKVLTEAGKQEYADLYVAAGADQLVGDASTGYSKLPDRPGVVERAVAVLPEDFRAIYIIREPISRIISQHYHEFSRGLVGADINAVVREHPRYLDFSRYAWQLRPWVEAIGRDRIRVVLFEQYKSSRSAVVAETCRFLGLDPDERPAIDEQEVFNAGDGKPVPGPIWNAIRGNKMYQKLVRPLVSSRARHHLRKYFMRKAPPRPTPPSAETIAWLQQELANDREELAAQWDISPWGDVPAN
ncbi:sulfotransferase domain-containing protein [Aeoliella sp. ICT_H6.2]|uniref:Sulfotransferase domain-containing protein n=1 Tax=Aeoliella straminimaris TaxID=2954799 RepID=A0A9X2JFD3_9BACT|nr:sulfotransferase domain-containing protein [Aeoliella straminimaris]MCO6043197.1 sulfotransferase domain-containing protein [Aeoliella straminimaris]